MRITNKTNNLNAGLGVSSPWLFPFDESKSSPFRPPTHCPASRRSFRRFIFQFSTKITRVVCVVGWKRWTAIWNNTRVRLDCRGEPDSNRLTRLRFELNSWKGHYSEQSSSDWFFSLAIPTANAWIQIQWWCPSVHFTSTSRCLRKSLWCAFSPRWRVECCIFHIIRLCQFLL